MQVSDLQATAETAAAAAAAATTTTTTSVMSEKRAMRFVLCLIQITLMMAGVQTMAIDQLIANAAETPAMLAMSPPIGEGGSSDITVELDMVYSQKQWQEVQKAREQWRDPRAGRSRRKAIRDAVYRWQDGIIPYEIDESFTNEDLSEILTAIGEWEKLTCLKFVRAGNYDQNKIVLKNAGGCFSRVGMVRELQSQTVGLAPGCRFKGVVLHELGHALGFQHEQTRPDRDHNVDILFHNIKPGLQYNFRKFRDSQVDTRAVPYDYRSIMHYGEKYFTSNGQLTIRTRDPSFQKVIGEARELSFLDVKLANLLYKCSAHCSHPKECPPQGFLDKTCRCMCPGDPVRECSSSDRLTGSGTGSGTTSSGRRTGSGTGSGTTTTWEAARCVDQYPKCKVWAALGKCRDQDRPYMEAYCRQSCSLCHVGPVCKDQNKHCGFWREEGHCTDSFAHYMRLNCNRSCGFCSTHTRTVLFNADVKDREDTTMTSVDFQKNVGDGSETPQSMALSVVVGVVGVLLIRE